MLAFSFCHYHYKIFETISLRRRKDVAREMAQQARVLVAFVGDRVFTSQHLHGSKEPSITPALYTVHRDTCKQSMHSCTIKVTTLIFK